MPKVVITNEFLIARILKIKAERDIKIAKYGSQAVGHVGITVDLCCEILRLRGEPIPEHDVPPYSEFIVD